MRYSGSFLGFVLAASMLSGCGGRSDSPGNTQGIPGTISSPVTVDMTPCDNDHAPSSPPFDLAISGSGRFKLTSGGVATYVRSGRFHAETTSALSACGSFPGFSGYIVDAGGKRLNGSTSPATEPGEINLFTDGDMAPKATTTVSAQANLDSAAPNKSPDTFDPAVAATYNFTRSIDVFDTLGWAHTLRIFYLKTAVNEWLIRVVAEGTQIDVGRLTFDAAGNIASSVPDMPAAVSIPLMNGASTPLTFRFDPAGTVASTVPSSMVSLTQNGYATGVVSGFLIATDGTITRRYSNGQLSVLGKVAIVD